MYVYAQNATEAVMLAYKCSQVGACTMKETWCLFTLVYRVMKLTTRYNESRHCAIENRSKCNTCSLFMTCIGSDYYYL